MAVTLDGRFSNENIHLNGNDLFKHRTFTITSASLLNSSDAVEFALSSNTENVQKTIGIIFEDSNLKFIPQQIFVAFPALQVLYIDGQQLVEFKQNYFIGATSLRTLWAPNNEITQIGPNTFSYMGNLYTLDLSNNPIDYIHSLAFNGIPRMEILNLSGTKLMKISFSNFWYMFQLKNIDFSNANGNTNCLNQNFKPIKGDLSELKQALSKKCTSSVDRTAEDNKRIQKLERANKKLQTENESLKESIARLESVTPEPCPGESNGESTKLVRENTKLKAEKINLTKKLAESNECCTEVDVLTENISDLEASTAAKTKKATADAKKMAKLRADLAECREGSAETVAPGPCDCKKITKALQEQVDKLTTDLIEETEKCDESAQEISKLNTKNKGLELKISQLVSGGMDCGHFPLLTKALVKACVNADLETTTKSRIDRRSGFDDDE